MIGRIELQERAGTLGLAEEVVEKDYVIGWVLWGIANDDELSDSWVFKGGTSLKKCYIDTYRFSEDLDFTVIPPQLMDETSLERAIVRVLTRVGSESGIGFSAQVPRVEVRREGKSAEGRVYYIGPRRSLPSRIKIDLRSDEIVVRPSVLRKIDHPYSDGLPERSEVRCYAFDELFAEKIRAMGERSRPRDLYDIVNLFWRPDFREHGPLIRQVLDDKCRSKGIPAVTLATIVDSAERDELERDWANMLKRQLPELPEFEQFWNELPDLFAWLDGADVEILPPLGVDKDTDVLWRPPATFWSSGPGIALEPVRYGAVNRQCIELGYLGTKRLIEPYSLRRTNAGDIVLHAMKIDPREHRTYRVDRIQSVRVVNRPFKPVYAIEFTPEGDFIAPPSPPRVESALPVPRVSRTPRARVRSVRPRARSSRYVVQCLSCGKRFYRDKPGTRIAKHKAKDGYWACGGRSGYYV